MQVCLYQYLNLLYEFKRIFIQSFQVKIFVVLDSCVYLEYFCQGINISHGSKYISV